MLVLVLDASKDDGLVGKAEGLRNHSHNHGYLRAGTVDAQLLAHVAALVEVGEEHLVGRLVQDSGNAQYQDRPGVAEHGAQQFHVELPAESRVFRNQADGKHGSTRQVDIEHIAHVLAVHVVEINEVQHDAYHDVQ